MGLSRSNLTLAISRSLTDGILSSPLRKSALLFLACLLFHSVGTQTLPLIDRAEPRFAEASREMRERGDYVVPYFNNEYRLDKPPVIYWLQVASYYLFSENDFSARLPSIVAAALTAVLLFAWGKRLGDERVGWWAAVIFSLCLQVFLHGKASLPDMWLVFFVTAAHWAAFELIADWVRATSAGAAAEQQKYWRVVFYFALALAFLAKGPIGWTPLLTVASTKVFLRDQPLRRRFWFASGTSCMVAIVLAWGIPALLRTNGEFFHVGLEQHVFARSVRSIVKGQETSAIIYLATLPFYFLAVFVSFFPWSIKLPALTRRLWRGRDRIDKYLVAGIVPIFLVHTLIYTKFFHYTLPAFPLLSLLLARHLSQMPGGARFAPRAAVSALIIFLSAAVFLFPFFARTTPSLQLFKQSRDDLRPEMEFANVGYRQPSVVWYFRSRVRGWFHTLHPTKVHAFMDSPGARLVILPTQTAQELYPTIPQDWKSFRARGFLTPEPKRLDLTLILKP